MRTRRVAAALVAGVLVLAACGGDDGGDDGGNPVDPGGNGGDDTDQPSTGDDELDAVLERQREASVKVTYRSDDDSEFTIAQDPPRSAFRSEGSVLIDAGDDGPALQCTLDDSDEITECTEFPISGEFFTYSIGSLFPLASMLYQSGGPLDALFDTETTSEEIAGRSGTCVSLDASDLAEQFGADLEDDDTSGWRTCIDDETGWPLLFEGLDADGGTSGLLEAVEFSTPSDADFAIPEDITPGTIPGLDEVPGLDEIPGFDPDDIPELDEIPGFDPSEIPGLDD